MITYDDIDDMLVKRMACRIRIWSQTGSQEFPYRAIFHVADNPNCVTPGHPYVLTVEANTPKEAVEGVIALIYAWMTDPRSPFLELSTENIRTRACGSRAQ